VLQQSEAFSSIDADHDGGVVRQRRVAPRWEVKCCGDGVSNKSQVVVHGWKLRECKAKRSISRGFRGG
jgi:hypothetical protein